MQQKNKTIPVNFLRHYYDIYKLLENEHVLKFIGSDEYIAHKKQRFPDSDESNIMKNSAFTMPDQNVRNLYSEEFKQKSAIYFGKQIEFKEVLDKISQYIQYL